MTDHTHEILFEAGGVNKSFPGVKALCDVDYELRVGEVHALVGENGAGKSTLAKIMGGSEIPDSGRMHFNREPYQPRRRCDAESKGVRMVMQELNLIANFSIAENIFIRKLPHRFGFIDYNRLDHDAGAIMSKVGLGDINPRKPVRELGVGQQQMVEIAAGLSRKCRVIILDEPTASLTDNEIQLLFAQIRKLKANGVSIVYISHRIEEVISLADRVTVLRDGKKISTQSTRNVNSNDIIQMMVGRKISAKKTNRQRITGKVALNAVGLKLGDRVNDVSFKVHRGETLGIAGLMGSGRTETMRAVFGADQIDEGKIYLYGSDEPAKIHAPRDAVRNGIAFITEDRKEQGLFLTLPVRTNITLGQLNDLSRCGWIDFSGEQVIADKYIDLLGIRCWSCEQPAGQLSGGNQQKVVISKWIYRGCDILIFDEPTRGIDVGARYEIYQLLGKLAEEGKAIIVISSDLKELMTICDNIAVMSAGNLVAQYASTEWSAEKITAAAFSRYVKTSKQNAK
ncbi:MAG: sugar ABC transporter ATP-binding protein [Planctomycetes bacterium]|nr:sugar ABC transporter ATP-binding protein [Planctomycetota bacterium]